jgi:hypothetical protein
MKMNIISALMTLIGIVAISFAVFGILEAMTAPQEKPKPKPRIMAVVSWNEDGTPKEEYNPADHTPEYYTTREE